MSAGDGRHYLDRDFPEINDLVTRSSVSGARVRLLECGCGVGNAFYPLVAKFPCLDVFAVDLSARAIELIKVPSSADSVMVRLLL